MKESELKTLEAFHRVLDSSRLAEELAVSPHRARQLWRRVRKKLAKERLTEEAAHQMVAETDEFLAALERSACGALVTYNGGADKLNGYAALVRQLKEIRMTRLQILQDLRLVPSLRSARHDGRAPEPKEPEDEPEGTSSEPAGVPVGAAPLTVEDLDAEIRELQRERERLQAERESTVRPIPLRVKQR